MNEGTVLNKFMQTILNQLDAGYGFIHDDVMWLFHALVVIQLTLLGIYWALGASGAAVAGILRRGLLIGLILYFIDNFPLLVDTLAQTFIQFGIDAGGGQVSRADVLDPGRVATQGWTIADMLLDEVATLTGPVGTLTNLPEIVLLLVSAVVVLVAFLLIGLQVMIAFVSLKMGALAAFVLLPFAVLRSTAFLSERPLGFLVSSAVRLMLISLVVSISLALFSQFTVANPNQVQLREAVGLAFGSVVVLTMSLLASRLARDVVSGAPSLGLGDVAAVAVGATGAVVGAAAASHFVSQRSVSAGRGAVNAVRAAVNAATGSPKRSQK